MARRKSVEELQRQLQFATARKAFLATVRPRKATNDNRAKDVRGYASTLLGTVAASAAIKVQVSRKAIAFFGANNALKLILPTEPEFETAGPLPRGFTPAKISALFGDATPAIVTAAGSLRKYIKYSRSVTSENQASYTAPVGGTGAKVTTKDQIDTVKLIATAIKTTITEYGRVSFTPETFSQSFA